MSLDDELKRALRAEDPGDEFTARVLERIRASQQQERGERGERAPLTLASVPAAPAVNARAARPRMVAWFAAMAATLTLTVGGAQWIKHRAEIAEGERARAEVLAALRLTSEKLSIVHAAIAEKESPR